MAKLVIVESPAKARTITKYLGKEYRVSASVGHIMDLPPKSLGVDIDKDFKPTYEVMPSKKKTVAGLKKEAKEADEIFLAPDPDREGEAIAWHLAKLLKSSGKPMKRVNVNEITKQAIIDAIENAGELNQEKFEAQQARRILDRLVGYLISPLLSKKFRGGLSAGRVQSVALRLVVDREREIRAFDPKEYWSIEARLEAGAPPKFTARLVSIDGKTVEAPTEKFKENRHTMIPDEAFAKKIVDAVSGSKFIINDISEQQRKRNPAPPFITSTLQQEAARKLGFSAKKTMMVAQRLYEGQDIGAGPVGLITYMRTDAPRLANQAIDMVRGHIVSKYGKEYLPDNARQFRAKKSAQEAHEAIRPTSIDHTPELVAKYLDKDMSRLYELIFRRFVACQMEAAVYDQTTVEIPIDEYLFRASGRVLKFKGFLAVYEEGVDDEKDNDKDSILPSMKVGDELKLEELVPEQHFTKPPPRFTEASLVKELETKGIGRPSTYAQTLSTISDRKYVENKQKKFYATPLGERITDVLIATFPDILAVDFTAQMEENLDQVEVGKEDWVKLLHKFYKPFSKRLEAAGKILDEMSQDIPTDIPCPDCESELMIKWSKKGEFLGCSAYPDCRFTTDFVREEDGTINPTKKESQIIEIPCPECGEKLQVRSGKKGDFVGCTAYPDCTFTSNFERDENKKIYLVKGEDTEDTGIICEKCKKAMVIKKTRRGDREFLACSGYPKCKNAMDFTREEDGTIKPVPKEEKETDFKCEKCKKPMVVKVARSSGKEFLACTGYPKCKNAKDFVRDKDGEIKLVNDGDPGPKCEECGKPTEAKRGRWGYYWKCTGAPKCKFTLPLSGKKKDPAKGGGKNAVEELPDEPPCENCGKPMVRRQGRFGPFVACSGYPTCKNIRKKKKDEE